MKIKLPIYNGPDLVYGNHSLAIKNAGPAPRGWRYLRVGERIPAGPVIFINYNGWEDGTHAVGQRIHNRDLPWAIPAPVDTEYVGSKTDFLRLRILRRNSKKVEFVIDSQKLRGFPLFVAKNGVRVQSMDYPDIWIRNWDTERPLTFFTRGADKSKDSDAVTVTPAQFKLISAAVAELNEARREAPKVAVKVDLSARIKELEKEVTDLKAFKAGVEALLRKKA